MRGAAPASAKASAAVCDPRSPRPVRTVHLASVSYQHQTCPDLPTNSRDREARTQTSVVPTTLAFGEKVKTLVPAQAGYTDDRATGAKWLVPQLPFCNMIPQAIRNVRFLEIWACQCVQGICIANRKLALVSAEWWFILVPVNIFVPCTYLSASSHHRE